MLEPGDGMEWEDVADEENNKRFVGCAIISVFLICVTTLIIAYWATH